MHVNMDRSGPQVVRIVGIPQVAIRPSDEPSGGSRLDALSNTGPTLTNSQQLLSFALEGSRTLRSEHNGDRVINWLPHPQVFRVINVRDRSILNIAHEAIKTRDHGEKRDQWTTALTDEIDRLLGDDRRPTPLDPMANGIRRIHRISAAISRSVGVPLVLKEIPEGYFDSVINLNRQLLRMRTLQRLAAVRLSSEEQKVIDFCRVFASYFRPHPNGKTTQWMLMEEVEQGEMCTTSEFSPGMYPEIARITGMGHCDFLLWSDVRGWLRDRGLPPRDLHGENVLRTRNPDGTNKFTIIDQ